MMPSFAMVAAASALSAGIAFTGGWKVQGAFKDAEILKNLKRINEAIAKQVDAEESERLARDQKVQISIQLSAALDREAELHNEEVTEARIEYITKDPNATDCGFSAGGVRVWNAAATGKGVPEAEAARPRHNAEAIAASNADIARAAETSFKRHWAAIRQIGRLQAHIINECTPLN